uniref:uncharacterized protein LOC123462720 n=1 Tax=Jaculus jaculus TaxID=51337 RepID=UPI001E1B6125|nr:uncharacterized protein LOC123462720 [Jaculus jaculus]
MLPLRPPGLGYSPHRPPPSPHPARPYLLGEASTCLHFLQLALALLLPTLFQPALSPTTTLFWRNSLKFRKWRLWPLHSLLGAVVARDLERWDPDVRGHFWSASSWISGYCMASAHLATTPCLPIPRPTPHQPLEALSRLDIGSRKGSNHRTIKKPVDLSVGLASSSQGWAGQDPAPEVGGGQGRRAQDGAWRAETILEADIPSTKEEEETRRSSVVQVTYSGSHRRRRLPAPRFHYLDSKACCQVPGWLR